MADGGAQTARKLQGRREVPPSPSDGRQGGSLRRCHRFSADRWCGCKWDWSGRLVFRHRAPSRPAITARERKSLPSSARIHPLCPAQAGLWHDPESAPGALAFDVFHDRVRRKLLRNKALAGIGPLCGGYRHMIVRTELAPGLRVASTMSW